MTLEAAAGNPGARLNATTTTLVNGPVAYDNAIDNNVAITQALSGAFSLSLDVLSGAGDFGAGQAIGLLVQQGSDLYLDNLGVTGSPQASFQNLVFTGSFIPASFSHLSGAGSSTPDFSGATSSFIGFSAINSSNNRTLTKYYDNFGLTYSAATPEPSTFAMLAGAMLFTLCSRGRGRRP